MKKEIKIPKGWSDITLSKFLKLQALKTGTENYMFEYLSVMLDMTEEKLKNYSLNELQKFSAELIKMSSSKLEASTERLIRIDDEFYVAVFDFKDAPFGQYVDLQIFKDSSEDYWQYAHKLAGSFIRRAIPLNSLLLKLKMKFGYIPKIEDFVVDKYNSEECIKNSILFKEKMGMDMIFTALTFFLIWKEASSQTTKDSSKKEEEQTQETESQPTQKSSTENGIGTQQ